MLIFRKLQTDFMKRSLSARELLCAQSNGLLRVLSTISDKNEKKGASDYMAQVFASPGRYIQGEGELANLYSYIKSYGSKFFIIGTERRVEALRGVIEASFGSEEEKLSIAYFNGECSKNEVNRLVKVMQEQGCDCVVGVGGGKVMDTAKAVAYQQKTPTIIVPTAASSDAPTSALSVLYTDDGVLDEVVIFDKNPELILVDTGVITKAGPRLLVAGMGDALATYFEARGCIENYRSNFVGGRFTQTSWALAKLCYEMLLENGAEARLAVEQGCLTKAVEDVIEANTLLSGLGFESNGVTGAHSVYYGFTVLEQHEEKLHGEFVAFGTICLLILENRPSAEIDQVIRFCRNVGLPTTLDEINMHGLTPEQMDQVAAKATADVETIHNEPFTVTPGMVKSAILTADKIGRLYQNGGSIL